MQKNKDTSANNMLCPRDSLWSKRHNQVQSEKTENDYFPLTVTKRRVGMAIPPPAKMYLKCSVRQRRILYIENRIKH